MKVINKSGCINEWNNEKIVTAINKAASRVDCSITHNQAITIANACKKVAGKYLKDNCISSAKLHEIVISQLIHHNFNLIASAYQEYRDYKNTYAKSWEQLKEDADQIIFLGDRENANFDSSLVSTKGSLVKGALTKELYKQFYLSKTEKFLTKRGDIYIHDLRDMIFGSVNCCLFDIGNVLKGGFKMSGINYTEPKTVLSALQVIGDITLVATAQQFGGFTLPELDKVLLPYVIKSYDRYLIDYDNNTEKAKASTIRELEQGFQALELKLNTVPSSRGDFAFTTITFGQWNINEPTDNKYWLNMIGSVILKVRQKGYDGVPVVFPKLVFLYDKNLIDHDDYASELFNEAVKCSSKCMYPDYLSLTGNIEQNQVGMEYHLYNKIISPMGCRAYLSHWVDPKTNKVVTVGRCNIGAVSLNIPLIIAVAKKEFSTNWKESFWNLLSDRLQVIREFLCKRYEIIRHTKASTNPLAFTQGGFYNGYRQPDEEVGDLVDYMTASFGITALNEATVLWCGKSLYEDKSIFANKVIDFILAKLDKYKEQDHHLYALYGTPAESLCGTQATQYREYTGDNQFGSFFSNSFHCHVSEDITPIEKQDTEAAAFHKVAGGHIQYVRLDNPENLEATKAIIERGMSLGFYQGVNFDSCHCNDCGTSFTNGGKTCPSCGSHNITTISRVCGYLGYSNINGHTRMNDAKLDEIKQRKSM
jgi:ribonucleoside-triphosphate reductase